MKVSRTKLLLAGLLLILFGVVTTGVYAFKSKPYPGANDFYSRWSGANSFWTKGLDPYGEEASLAIQIGIYGRPVVEGEDPGYFVYPMYTAFLIAPLAPLPYAWAEAIWLTLLIGLLMGALLLLLNAYNWRPGPLLLGGTILWTIFFYPAFRGIMLGQPGIAVYFLQVLALWALVKKREGLAGFALAISTIKPQMGFLLVPFILLWALWYRRWRLIGWFAGIWGGLMLLSFAVLPTWFASWWGQLTIYTSYTAVGSPVWVLSYLYLQWGSTGETIISIILLLILCGAWWRAIIQRKTDEFGWAFCLTLTVTHLIALRTASPHFVVFIIPLIFYFKLLTDEDPKRGPWVVGLIQAVLTFGLWIMVVQTFIPDFGNAAQLEHPATYLPLPFGILLLLLFTRSTWAKQAPLTPGGIATHEA